MIDRNTVQQIVDTADVVDVVSDFVSLRQRGANWVGLCPFHNDRTPSFYVSRNKQIYKCFSCGEAGSSVNFLMKHEQMSYVDALKYLAAKYHIEIKERELTDEERAARTERESMQIVNEWACQWMEQQLWETQEGQEIGLSYFRERGFSDATIRHFRLGYSPEGWSALYKAATAQGYNRDLLFRLGLCKEDNHGGGYDFFRGRAMFPIQNVAGRVIAFGGRTLRKGDNAKYFNSPESPIYSKSGSTMYGLFQAKKAISQLDRCFIVEGYADVISMHQAGFENVIASSGTALTDGHIHLLHRFTDNVTELFDGDEAGVNAALKGIDKLLTHGLNVKVLLLPDGHDPDSYCQTHSSTEIQHYIDQEQSDFIQFKTRVLLQGAQHDPIRRAQAITEVVKSIACIPAAITRAVYAKECSRLFETSEDMLLREIQKQRNAQRASSAGGRRGEVQPTPTLPQPQQPKPSGTHSTVREEQFAIYLIAKFGMCNLCQTSFDNGETRATTVVEHMAYELSLDHMAFTQLPYQKIFDVAQGELEPFAAVLSRTEQEQYERVDQLFRQQMSQINPVGMSGEQIENEEKRIRSELDLDAVKHVNAFRQHYLEHLLCSHPDDQVRVTSCNLLSEPEQLSKMHADQIATELDRLPDLVDLALNSWKNAIIGQQIDQIQNQMRTASDQVGNSYLLQRLQQLYKLRRELAKRIGDRVVNPK